MDVAERLFDRLLQERRLISYIDAYEALLGRRPRRWLHRAHSREVTTVAHRAAPRQFEELTIHLDALIVRRSDREPGPGHFKDQSYDLRQWRRVFGGWPLT
jgi:hypothetical protein